MGDAPVWVDTVGLPRVLVTAGGDSPPPVLPFGPPLVGLLLREGVRAPLLLLLALVGLPCCRSWKGTVALMGCSRLP